jgi:hypothetical protein
MQGKCGRQRHSFSAQKKYAHTGRLEDGESMMTTGRAATASLVLATPE